MFIIVNNFIIMRLSNKHLISKKNYYICY